MVYLLYVITQQNQYVRYTMNTLLLFLLSASPLTAAMPPQRPVQNFELGNPIRQEGFRVRHRHSTTWTLYYLEKKIVEGVAQPEV